MLLYHVMFCYSDSCCHVNLQFLSFRGLKFTCRVYLFSQSPSRIVSKDPTSWSTRMYRFTRATSLNPEEYRCTCFSDIGWVFLGESMYTRVKRVSFPSGVIVILSEVVLAATPNHSFKENPTEFSSLSLLCIRVLGTTNYTHSTFEY